MISFCSALNLLFYLVLDKPTHPFVINLNREYHCPVGFEYRILKGFHYLWPCNFNVNTLIMKWNHHVCKFLRFFLPYYQNDILFFFILEIPLVLKWKQKRDISNSFHLFGFQTNPLFFNFVPFSQFLFFVRTWSCRVWFLFFEVWFNLTAVFFF